MAASDYEQVTYDANDNVKTRRMRDAQVISYDYDGLNRQTTKNLPSPEVDVSSTYDLQGNSLTVSQGSFTVSRSYDALGLMRTETTPRGTMTHDYDEAGRRKQTTWPDAFYVTQDYFITGEPWHIREYGATSGPGVLGTYAYDNRGRRARLTRGNGTVTDIGYDDVSRVTSLSHDLASTGADVSTTFAYNPASQLRSWSRNNDAYAWASNPIISRSYSVNGLNQLTQTASGGSTVIYDYDGRGNLTDEGSTGYSYSVENRLLTSSNGAALSYDSIGRLSQTSSGAGTVRLQYDGVDVVTEYNTSGTVLRRYVHGPGADEPLVWYEGSGTSDRRWLHQDERDSVVAVSDAAGAVLNINTYDEFGIPASGNLGRFQYTGQTWLADVGMFYYKARIYSPTLGRFLQTDPVGYDDDSNLYAYVRNDPLAQVDPSGQEGIHFFGKKDGLYLAAQELTNAKTPGFFTVQMHGNPTSGPYRHTADGIGPAMGMSASEIYQAMKNAGYEDGTLVMFLACGVADTKTVADLARMTNSAVLATTQYVASPTTKPSRDSSLPPYKTGNSQYIRAATHPRGIAGTESAFKLIGNSGSKLPAGVSGITGIRYNAETGMATFTYNEAGWRLEREISRCVQPEKCQ